MKTWLIILAVSLIAFLLRASFLVFADPHRFPHLFRQALTFVPPAVLAAIVAPGMLLRDGALDLSASNERFVAGLVAIAATMFVRNAMAAITAGMSTLWLLQWLGV